MAVRLHRTTAEGLPALDLLPRLRYRVPVEGDGELPTAALLFAGGLLLQADGDHVVLVNLGDRPVEVSHGTALSDLAATLAASSSLPRRRARRRDDDSDRA